MDRSTRHRLIAQRAQLRRIVADDELDLEEDLRHQLRRQASEAVSYFMRNVKHEPRPFWRGRW